jgi:hypothetical protein
MMDDPGEDNSEPMWFRVGGKVKVVTAKAFGIEVVGNPELIWLPKSQVKGVNGKESTGEPELDRGDEVQSALLPEWLGDEKGLEEDE